MNSNTNRNHSFWGPVQDAKLRTRHNITLQVHILSRFNIVTSKTTLR